MTASEPIDLAEIRADVATTAPCLTIRHACSDGYRAVGRLVDVHAPALLDLAEQQAATIARYDTALIEATRDLDRARRHIADLDGQIEGQGQALNAADLERDEARAEIGRLRRERTHGTTRRGCLALDCWTEFELFSPDDPATGWKQAQALGGYLCPVHAEALESHRPRPGYTPQRMLCSCGWESAPVHHRGAGTELWLDHAHEVVEGIAQLPPLPTTEDYRVVLRDETAADEPSGGWQQIGSTVPTQAEAEQQMATRRRHHPDWPEMAIWRQGHVWSVAAVETRDASRAPESPADTPAPGETPDAR